MTTDGTAPDNPLVNELTSEEYYAATHPTATFDADAFAAQLAQMMEGKAQ